ncbi:FimD/PapC C-terminal domain-containing protein, partial [Escherichia sp. R-CC3]
LADSGIVGDRGELYLSGLPEKGQVTLSWGENASTKCILYRSNGSKRYRFTICI